jgi:hypothetical protein
LNSNPDKPQFYKFVIIFDCIMNIADDELDSPVLAALELMDGLE